MFYRWRLRMRNNRDNNNNSRTRRQRQLPLPRRLTVQVVMLEVALLPAIIAPTNMVPVGQMLPKECDSLLLLVRSHSSIRRPGHNSNSIRPTFTPSTISSNSMSSNTTTMASIIIPSTPNNSSKACPVTCTQAIHTASTQASILSSNSILIKTTLSRHSDFDASSRPVGRINCLFIKRLTCTGRNGGNPKSVCVSLNTNRSSFVHVRKKKKETFIRRPFLENWVRK